MTHRGTLGGSVARIFKWFAIVIGTLLGLVILAVVLILNFFDLNQLREPIASAVSKSLGRPFAIHGDLTADWSWTPRFTIADVELANAPWGGDSPMFSLERMAVAIHVPDLFRGRIVLPEIVVTRPQLSLERNSAGRGNWEFDNEKEPPKQGEEGGGLPISKRWFPKIGRLAIEDGRFRFDDPKSDTRLDMKVSTAMGASDEQAVELNGQGNLAKETFRLKISGGSVLELWDQSKPFPLKVQVDYGATGAKVSGTIAEPLKLEGPDLRLEAQGPDLAALSPVVPVWIPETPPYRFSGSISRQGEHWLLKDFSGNLGGSDLRGDLMFTFRDERPYLQGDLKSRKLDMKDFVGIFGADPTPSPEAPPRSRLLPDKPYPVEGLRVADANLNFTSNNIVTPWMPVDDIAVHLKLDKGLATIDPVNLAVGLGNIGAKLTLDARRSPIETEVRANISKVPFKRLLKNTRFEPETAGTFFGRTRLTTVGNSVAEMAAHADGGITVLMEQGRISNLILELMGVDIAESLQKALGKDPSISVRCTIADFIVSDGTIKPQLFLVDTTDTNILMEGQIDLGTEALDLRMSAIPKDFSPFSARTPINIQGTLKKPRPYPDPKPLLARGAASVALGALLTPAAALIPWMDIGLGENSECRALVDAAAKGRKPAGKR